MMFTPSLSAVIICIIVEILCSCSGELIWGFTNNNTALCNDFTRAGFFHRHARVGNQKWVIVLEGGSLCYSSDTCNRRYFQSHLRQRYSSDFGAQNIFGNFDPAYVWRNTRSQPRTEVINPLMTSIYCFRNETHFFTDTDSDELSIEGRDVLSSDCDENPAFCDHGHVLVPYCSSDLWLGSEDTSSRQPSSLLGEEPCNCWDQDCFKYNPTSEDLQFTFRGQTIFRSVLETLDRMYDLQRASEIVLVGSSAGGVGVLNSAKWVREKFENVSIKVITDSSWFINFRDTINQEFETILSDKQFGNETHANVLLGILHSNEACNDNRLGSPCCLSAQCLLLEKSEATGSPYFPPDVPLFMVQSLYDLLILSSTLVRINSRISDLYNSGGFGHGLKFFMTVGEYGGEMNNSLTTTATKSNAPFSYYATQCFQHVYLAASTLRGSNKLLGSQIIKLSSDITTVSHRIESGVWSDQDLAYYEGEGYTIRDAINYWYWNVSNTSEAVVFRDECSGPHCSNVCPEEISLETSSGAVVWSGAARITIAAIVLFTAVICLIMKMYCCLWWRCLRLKQEHFLKNIKPRLDEEQKSMDETDSETSAVKIEFPNCLDENAISVACLNLHYYVNVHSSAKEREEKYNHSPITLNDLRPEKELTASPTRSLDLEATMQRGSKTTDKLGMVFGTHRKMILKGISAYFNPKELIAIMGPSGCGKTTFLDVLTGRSKTGTLYGDIFINGLPVENNRKWYTSNTGYVLQLAAPYYEELTVRENLTLAAWVKLHINSREKFQRVEQVMEVTGLMDLADTVVGGATGPGLSGGQKRRLTVALQLLKLPSVIFLDEPTSGLDSASSTELLTHLNALAASNRTVVLTIHQPRLEIFHMFHRIVVLSDGKVAYHGVPEKAYEVFVNSLQSCYLKKSLVIPDLEDHNPADVIMDILGNKCMRKMVTNYYEETGEQKLVSKAIAKAWVRERGFSDNSIDFDGVTQYKTGVGKFNTLRLMLRGSRHTGRTHNATVSRLAALEARAMKRASYSASLYLPIIFFGYGFLIGTVYYQQTTPFLIASGFCVYSVASALFMFPALYGYLSRALTIYSFERADGAGTAADLVVQSFVRFSSMALLPVIFCAGLLYLLLIHHRQWNLVEFLQVALVNIALNQVWTALLIGLIVTFPHKSFRLSPVLSAVAGFTSGFFIPIDQIPWWYRWLCYINPNYYGFSASAVILLSDFESDCERDGGSELECYAVSANYILDTFDFNDINPYENTLVLVCMTLLFLFAAVLSNWLKFSDISKFLAKFKLVIGQGLQTQLDQPLFYQLLNDSEDDNTDEEETAEYGKYDKLKTEVQEPLTEDPAKRLTKMNSFELQQPPPNENGTLTSNGTQLRPESIRRSIKAKRERRRALYLDEGQAHSVWKPRRYKKKVHVAVGVHTAMLEMEKYKQDLHERQQKLLSRVQATREVLKVQREELATLEEEKKTEEEEEEEEEEEGAREILGPGRHTMTRRQWRNVIARVMEERGSNAERRERRNRKKHSMYFHNIVSQYVAAMAKPSPYSEHSPMLPHSSLRNRVPSSTSLKVAPLRTGVVPLRQWKSLVFEDHHKVLQTQTSCPYNNNNDEESRIDVDHLDHYEADESETASFDDLGREKGGDRNSAEFTLHPSTP